MCNWVTKQAFVISIDLIEDYGRLFYNLQRRICNFEIVDILKALICKLDPANGDRSFEVVEVDASGGALDAGNVLGKVVTAGAVGAADGGNTGDGAMTVDAVDPVLDGASVGVYTVTFTEAVTNGGQYVVEDPDGAVVGIANVGDTFADQIKFVIADGAADFIVGDFFTVTVAAGSGKYVAYAAAATDGSATVAGILLYSVEAVSGDVTILKRDATFRTANLTYTGTEATILAGLEAIGIIARS